MEAICTPGGERMGHADSVLGKVRPCCLSSVLYELDAHHAQVMAYLIMS